MLFWRRRDFPAEVEDTGWRRAGDGYVAEGDGPPLVASTRGLDEDLEVILSAPTSARALISSDGFSRIVAIPPGGGRLSVIIPRHPAPPPAISRSLGCTAGLAVAFLLSLLALMRLARPGRAAT